MTTLPSPHAPHTPHAPDHPNEKPGYPPPPPTQSLLGSRVTAGGYSGQALEGGAGVPQGSPHGSVSVQSRLKNMIMSRQGGTYSGGNVDSPPLGEVHFSGHVAAVTSVANAEPAQMHESLKMAQNFLAYRTTESGPGSVVHANSTDVKGGVETTMAHANTGGSKDKHLDDGTPPLGTPLAPQCQNSEIKTENIKIKEEIKEEVQMKSECNVLEGMEVKEESEVPGSSIAPKPPDQGEHKPLSDQPESVGRQQDPGWKLSVYDFPDSPDANQSRQDFRFGRVRGAGPFASRPACANVSGAGLSPLRPPTPAGPQPPRPSPTTSGGHKRPSGSPGSPK